MSAEELAAMVCQALADAGITVTLTGGGCVAIWSEGKYVSRDLDFIEEGPVPRRRVKAVLEGLGFEERKKYYVHPASEFFVEFPTGPLMVGDERIETVERRDTSTGSLRLLSPTDCVKDRLAAFFHWNDRQALAQALLVARAQAVDIKEIRRWSKAEGEIADFESFYAALDN
jgi:hypothetical protein